MPRRNRRAFSFTSPVERGDHRPHLLSVNIYPGRLNHGSKVNRHKAAVDLMFRSVAQDLGSNAIGVFLTEMGADGANGMKEMHEVRSSTIIQDENTSVVWGISGAAVKLGRAGRVVSLNRASVGRTGGG